MEERRSWVYLLASRKHGTLYLGVTSDLAKRIWQHKAKYYRGFTFKYDVLRLVWLEEYAEIGMAIYREKQLKKWQRDWKIELIERENPEWADLYDHVVGQ